jgi:hypothetical protein
MLKYKIDNYVYMRKVSIIVGIILANQLLIIPVGVSANPTTETNQKWYIQHIDGGRKSEFTSIARDIQGNPHISYFNGTTASLSYAKWTGSTW